jgi:signal transduction histidine kinase
LDEQLRLPQAGKMTDQQITEHGTGPPSSLRCNLVARWMKPLAGGWQRLNLAAQFLVVGAFVLVLGMVAIGIWVTHRIEQGVIANSASSTALYVDSVISPLFENFTDEGRLTEGADRALDEILGQGSLGQRLAVFKIWLPNGSVAYSSDPGQIGQRFPMSDHLQQAFGGSVTSEFDHLDDEENALERESQVPLLEIYSPIRQAWSGEVIAVAEFYENGAELEAELAAARLQSWMIVLLITTAMLAALYLIVRGGSRVIDQQRRTLESRVGELSVLLEQNQALRQSVQAASDRSLALNEQLMRRVGADLHDGPAQLLALAQMRLGRTDGQRGETKELDQVRSHLDEAMREIRNISRGLALPKVETMTLSDLLRSVVATHEERTGHIVDLFAQDAHVLLDRTINIGLYRFVQESLSNASRHAGGAQLKVEAALDRDTLRLIVSDTGPGFDPNETNTGLGLDGMRQRIESLGGELSITSGPSGTRLHCTLPRTRSSSLDKT